MTGYWALYLTFKYKSINCSIDNKLIFLKFISSYFIQDYDLYLDQLIYI